MTESLNLNITSALGRLATALRQYRFWLCGAVALALNFSFWADWRPLLPCICLLVWPLWLCWQNQLQARQEKLCQRALRLLLQDSLAQLKLGLGLEESLRHGLHNLLRQLPDFAQYLEGRGLNLDQLETQMAQERNSAALARLLCPLFPIPELSLLRLALTEACELGQRSPLLLQRLERILSDLERCREEVLASQAQQRMEAVILALLPFCLAPFFRFLQNGPNPSRQSFWLQCLAWLLALAAIHCQVRLLAAPSRRPSPPRAASAQKPLSLSSWGHLSKFMTKAHRSVWLHFPRRLQLGAWQLQAYAQENFFAALGGGRTQQSSSVPPWLEKDLNPLLLGLLIWPPSLLLTLVGQRAFILPTLLGLCLPLLHLGRDLQLLQQRQRELTEQLPLLLSLIQALNQNGLPLLRALAELRDIFPQEQMAAGLVRSLYSALKQSQVSRQALEYLAAQIPASSSRGACLLLANYQHSGDQGLLQALDGQLAEAWMERRLAERRRLERRGGLFFLPMLLDLLSVMFLAAGPALMVFGQV